ncbi:LacI family DNA-binding transcriptional regulator [Mucilaginibacter terrae]|uniref:LacI family DNA-binding transcriptional regulator n=1 Tax=Mucilaginibacter terrae TaxID=1955052 RepID=UPI00362B3FD4
MKKVSIKTIADELGVVKSTVSFILNGKAREKRISKELEERVLKYVKESGYKPNQLAQNLSTGKTNLIGLIVEDICIPFFSSVARFIEDKAFQHGYKIVYASDNNDVKKGKRLLELLADRHVDGYIIAPTSGTNNEINSLLKRKIPVVLFNGSLQEVITDIIYIDNVEGGYIATKHLLDNGYKHIALVTIKSKQLEMDNRKIGYEKALKESESKPIICALPYGTEPEKAVGLIAKFLTKHKEIDAMFVTTSFFTISAIEAVLSTGKKLSEEIGFVTFDDQEFFKIYKPSITAVAQPIEEMSTLVIDTLLKKLKTEDNALQKCILSPKLIVRDSSSGRN